MKKFMRASLLFGVSGMLLNVAGLIAALNGKPCAAFIATGTIFLFVGAQALGREMAEAKKNADQKKDKP